MLRFYTMVPIAINTGFSYPFQKMYLVKNDPPFRYGRGHGSEDLLAPARYDPGSKFVCDTAFSLSLATVCGKNFGLIIRSMIGNIGYVVIWEEVDFEF